MLAGLLSFGFITELLSKPVRYGYINGIALTVLVGQLPKLLRLLGRRRRPDRRGAGLRRGVADGETNSVALVIGVACLRRHPRLQALAAEGARRAGRGGRRDGRGGRVRPGRAVRPLGGRPAAPGAAVVRDPERRARRPGHAGGRRASGSPWSSFADTSVLSRTFAIRGGYQVDPNQELVALGAANVAAGFFQGFSVSSSSSRTPVAEEAGAKTQLTGLVGAAGDRPDAAVRSRPRPEPARCGAGRRGDRRGDQPDRDRRASASCTGCAGPSSCCRSSASSASRSSG